MNRLRVAFSRIFVAQRWLSPVRAAAAILAFAVSFSADAGSFADRLAPGIPYYFENFDAGQRPWMPGQGLNLEEVFKNYQYFEIVVDEDGGGIYVNCYIQGRRAGSEYYRILSDGSLKKE